MQKRGQFFLIAAIIIVGLLFGITSAVNMARSNENNEAFYDLSREISYETKRVIDYGVYNQEDLTILVNGFLTTYADYIAQDKVLFLFGDEHNLSGLYFTNRAIGSVGINTGSSASNIIPIQQLSGVNADVTYNAATNMIRVIIDGIPYEFKLLEGQNFFFVIIKEDNDEAFVAAH